MLEPVPRVGPAGTQSITTSPVVAVADSADANGKAEPAAGKALPAIEQADLELLVQELNTTSRTIGRDLRFHVDLESRQSVIHVLDRETGEVIRRIPPEKVSTFINSNGSLAISLLDDRV